MNITKRSIPLAVIFSIITCGIYGLYWIVMLNDELNELVNEDNRTAGILVVILSIITCGIYSFYWNYKMGEKIDRLNGNTGSSTPILYLILSIIGLSIVNYCLIQDNINKYVG